MRQGGGLVAPFLVDAEVLSAVRGLTLAGKLESQRAAAGLDDLTDLARRSPSKANGGCSGRRSIDLDVYVLICAGVCLPDGDNSTRVSRNTVTGRFLGPNHWLEHR